MPYERDGKARSLYKRFVRFRPVQSGGVIVPAETPRRRPLPNHAAIVLEVIADFGDRAIPKNELELRAHQRGVNGRDVGDAIRAFHRRGWVEHEGSKLVVTEAAFELAQNGAPSRRQPNRIRQPRTPNLFS